MMKGKANMGKRHFDLFSAAREIAKVLRMLSKPFRSDFASMLLLRPIEKGQTPLDIAQHAGLYDRDLLQEDARRLASKMRGWSTQEIQIAVELAQRAVDWLEDLESRKEESSPESTAEAPPTAAESPSQKEESSSESAVEASPVAENQSPEEQKEGIPQQDTVKEVPQEGAAEALPVTAEPADLEDQQGFPSEEAIETPPIIAGSQSNGSASLTTEVQGDNSLWS